MTLKDQIESWNLIRLCSNTKRFYWRGMLSIDWGVIWWNLGWGMLRYAGPCIPRLCIFIYWHYRPREGKVSFDQVSNAHPHTHAVRIKIDFYFWTWKKLYIHWSLQSEGCIYWWNICGSVKDVADTLLILRLCCWYRVNISGWCSSHFVCSVW